MKRCIISGIVGAVAMFLLLFCIANIRACNQADEPSEYEHKDLVSKISQDECFICGSGSDFAYWGEDNVGIINLNTFEVLRLEINCYGDHGELIEEMARETIEMVTASVDAFVKKDVELAKKVIEQDDIVDDYFSRVKCGIITLIAENPADGEFALDLLMISKYFERIGDHATNIAEWVIYSVTGTHKEV